MPMQLSHYPIEPRIHWQPVAAIQAAHAEQLDTHARRLRRATRGVCELAAEMAEDYSIGPTGVEYTVEKYDGKEWVSEKHRTW